MHFWGSQGTAGQFWAAVPEATRALFVPAVAGVVVTHIGSNRQTTLDWLSWWLKAQKFCCHQQLLLQKLLLFCTFLEVRHQQGSNKRMLDAETLALFHFAACHGVSLPQTQFPAFVYLGSKWPSQFLQTSHKLCRFTHNHK